MSHGRTSSLFDHLDHCLVVFKHLQQNFLMRRLDVWKNKIVIIQIINDSLILLAFVNRAKWDTTWSIRIWFVFPRTETIRSHSSRARKPSNLNFASKEMIFDSVELCETEVCFLHIKLIGTNLWLPKTHNVPSDVDFESSRSPAKSESWKNPSLHCLEHYPHDKRFCIHMHDECKKSNDIIVCHKIWSIL